MKRRVSTKNARKKIRVLAFGTFDLLHAGHVHYLQSARKEGNELIVIVARDATVEKNKGRKPIQEERARVQLIGALKSVDQAVLGNRGNIFAKVQEINPDVIAMGYDQKPPIHVVKAALAALGMHPQIVRMKPFRKSEYKSSLLRQRVVEFDQKKKTNENKTKKQLKK